METFKIIYLDIGLKRPLKCGRSQGAWSYEVAREQIDAQKQENALDRDWNTSEAEKARDFQYDELMMQQEFQNAQRLASQEYQSGEWQRQFEVQNEYNNPTAQASRLRAAGINPQISMGGDAAKVVTGSSVSAPSGSAPSVPSPAAAQGVHGLSSVPFHPGTNLAQDLSQLAQATKAFGDAAKSGFDTAYLSQAMQPMLDLQIGKAANIELQNAWQQTQNALGKIHLNYGEKRELTELGKLEAEKQKAANEGQYYEGETALQEKRGKVLESLDKLQDSNAQVAGIQLQHLGQVLDSQAELNRASALEKRASANKMESETQTIDDLRDKLVQLKEQEIDFNKMENHVRSMNLDEEISSRLSQLKAQGAISDAQVNEAKLAKDRFMQSIKNRNKGDFERDLDQLLFYLNKDVQVKSPVNFFMPLK